MYFLCGNSHSCFPLPLILHASAPTSFLVRRKAAIMLGQVRKKGYRAMFSNAYLKLNTLAPLSIPIDLHLKEL